MPYHVLPSAPLDFNPRSHEGSDTRWHSTLRLTLSFQSTLPRGERLVIKVLLCETTYFNPRSHEGSDFLHVNLCIIQSISIHAPTRGATKRERLNTDEVNQFQSTLPRGERPVPTVSMTSLSRFQSTLPRGERQQFSPKSSLFSQQKLSKIFNLNNKLF